jgi:hypothetical protein
MFGASFTRRCENDVIGLLYYIQYKPILAMDTLNSV